MGLRLWGMCDIIVQGGGHTVSPEIPFPRPSPILNKTSVQQLPICTRPVDNRIPSRASITFPLKPMWQTAYLIEVILLLLYEYDNLRVIINIIIWQSFSPPFLFECRLIWREHNNGFEAATSYSTVALPHCATLKRLQCMILLLLLIIIGVVTSDILNPFFLARIILIAGS